MISTVSVLAAGARFFGTLPWYVRRKVTPEVARAMLRDRLANRGRLLIDRIAQDVLSRKGSVYERLMAHAGCELGDVEAAVRQEGVEGALRQLLHAGIYLTVDEFKGRTPVRRGSLTLEVSPEQLRSPRAAYHLPASSGGSRSAGTPVLIDFRFVRACAANCLLQLQAWGGDDWVKGVWEAPGAGARFRLTKFAMFGEPPQAWFTQIDPNDRSIPAIFRWNTLALRWSSRLAGRTVPTAVTAPLNDPTPIVEWLARTVQQGVTPVVFTFPGSAVRACLTAAEKRLSIAGTQFLLAGEPITDARVATVRQAGCGAIPRYGSMECGAIGYGCPNGEHADDVHLLEHMHGLIAADGAAPGLGVPESTLFITALHAYSPFLMLNVSMGDQAHIVRRACGCAWDRLGLGVHLSSIRSFEKLTGGGVTFFGVEVIEILERVLPAEFGGAPTDYQLVEEEGPTGETQLLLSVSPAVGAVDESRVAEVFLQRLTAISEVAAVMTRIWRDAGTVRVVRRPPAMSRAGKILHFHISRKP
ncbi:MAG: hypothetical protein JNN08_16510 [Bryobacterales bacterium]|nr:hypothetical protein [Bryobacterales bacterium]